MSLSVCRSVSVYDLAHSPKWKPTAEGRAFGRRIGSRISRNAIRNRRLIGTNIVGKQGNTVGIRGILGLNDNGRLRVLRANALWLRTADEPPFLQSDPIEGMVAIGTRTAPRLRAVFRLDQILGYGKLGQTVRSLVDRLAGDKKLIPNMNARIPPYARQLSRILVAHPYPT